MAAISRFRCSITTNFDGKLESTDFSTFQKRKVSSILEPCYKAFVTVDSNGTAWYMPQSTVESNGRAILPLNDSASVIYSQQCASVSVSFEKECCLH